MVRNNPCYRLRGIVALVCFVAVLLPVAAFAGDDHPAPPAESRISPQQTLQIDAQTIAAERGWDQTAALAHLERQDATGAFVAQLAVDYPATFAGSWTGNVPDGQLFVRFVGRVPTAAQDQAKQQGIAVVFVGGAKHSLANQDARADRIHADLVAHGHPQVVTAFSVEKEKTFATAMRARGDQRPAAELRAQLSAESRASDVALSFAQGPIAGNTHTYGGDKVFNSSTGAWCTSGFTVYQAPTNTYGVSTAGHCNVNTYQQEDGLTYGMTMHVQHRGGWGDLEYHTTTHPEYPEFYANTGARRDTLAVEGAAAIRENNSYCKYGRASGYTCDTVKLTSVDVTVDNFSHRQLVAMTQNKAIPGDSGGPWFLGNTAAGIQSGYVTIDGVRRDTWSKADYLDEALGVVVYRK